MYNLAPPKDSLEWSLGLVMDVILKLGLGKPGTFTESWTEAEVCEHLSVSQIRHWHDQPPGTHSEVIKRFCNLVTAGEAYAEEWTKVIQHCAARPGLRSEQRIKYFGTARFTKTARQRVIVPTLERMESLDSGEIERVLAVENQKREQPYSTSKARLKWCTFSSSTKRKVLLSSVLLLVAAFIWVKFSGKTADKYVFGKVFTNIQFCSVQEFQYLPNNTCLSDTRTFTTEHKKINLSFESAVPIDQGATFTLQWLRNGILQMEKPRPWLKAFAFEYKYASTHIKMIKRDGLPEEWADPGRYHVRFFVDGILVDEVRFDIVESLSS